MADDESVVSSNRGSREGSPAESYVTMVEDPSSQPRPPRSRGTATGAIDDVDDGVIIGGVDGLISVMSEISRTLTIIGHVNPDKKDYHDHMAEESYTRGEYAQSPAAIMTGNNLNTPMPLCSAAALSVSYNQGAYTAKLEPLVCSSEPVYSINSQGRPTYTRYLELGYTWFATKKQGSIRVSSDFANLQNDDTIAAVVQLIIATELAGLVEPVYWTLPEHGTAGGNSLGLAAFFAAKRLSVPKLALSGGINVMVNPSGQIVYATTGITDAIPKQDAAAKAGMRLMITGPAAIPRDTPYESVATVSDLLSGNKQSNKAKLIIANTLAEVVLLMATYGQLVAKPKAAAVEAMPARPSAMEIAQGINPGAPAEQTQLNARRIFTALNRLRMIGQSGKVPAIPDDPDARMRLASTILRANNPSFDRDLNDRRLKQAEETALATITKPNVTPSAFWKAMYPHLLVLGRKLMVAAPGAAAAKSRKQIQNPAAIRAARAQKRTPNPNNAPKMDRLAAARERIYGRNQNAAGSVQKRRTTEPDRRSRAEYTMAPRPRDPELEWDDMSAGTVVPQPRGRDVFARTTTAKSAVSRSIAASRRGGAAAAGTSRRARSRSPVSTRPGPPRTIGEELEPAEEISDEEGSF